MKNLPRRSFLATPALLLTRNAVAETLLPGHPGALSLTPGDGGVMMFRSAGIDDFISVPATQARIAFALPIAGREVAGIAFAAGSTLELVTLVGWDNARLRILGLEVLNWKIPTGAMLSSRFSSTGDRTRLLIARYAALPRPGLPRHWENWTDLLAWRDGAPLADAPVHHPPAGTMQARLADLRQRSMTLIAPPFQILTTGMLDSLDVAGALD